jgi:hypothetical protein
MKKKENPKEHEEKYILFLEKQLKWINTQNWKVDSELGCERTRVIFKLSKARLKLKVL